MGPWLVAIDNLAYSHAMTDELRALWNPPSITTSAIFIAIVAFVLLAICAGVYAAERRALRAFRQGALTERLRGGAESGKPEQVRDPKRTATTVLIIALVWLLATGLYVGSGMIGALMPVSLVLFMVVCNGAGVALAFSRFGARLAHYLPFSALAGFQVFRLPLELVLHSWSETGTMPVQMTYDGHNFDILTGVAALSALIVSGVTRRDIPKWAAWAFNLLGSGLLSAVFVVVVLSSPLPLKSYAGPPILLAFYLPYAWIVTFPVAGALAGHLVLWRKLFEQVTVSSPPGRDGPRPEGKAPRRRNTGRIARSANAAIGARSERPGGELTGRCT